ncbi:hypothetical protein EDB81DRAFT_952624 [Dactylonectria macrodidyma]|uniref:LysM domain-containing protein n=1 Tax=Dactylonectria macrodidyma TaxID=307937 RepID=A0A9P9DHU9_9HYPO|nr:hypothetical protein EDB81DRAFT_952624 [Dactylonectria macrodidyma]
MRSDVLLSLAAFFGLSAALRRGCQHSGNGEGWYYTTHQDTLTAVAADFCTSPAVIKQWNHINDIRPGINLKVPCHWNAGHQRDCLKNSDQYGAYTIQSGDELKDIAYDFCTTSDHLQQLNANVIKNKDAIFPKQVIQVPCSFN